MGTKKDRIHMSKDIAIRTLVCVVNYINREGDVIVKLIKKSFLDHPVAF